MNKLKSNIGFLVILFGSLISYLLISEDLSIFKEKIIVSSFILLLILLVRMTGGQPKAILINNSIKGQKNE